MGGWRFSLLAGAAAVKREIQETERVVFARGRDENGLQRPGAAWEPFWAFSVGLIYRRSRQNPDVGPK